MLKEKVVKHYGSQRAISAALGVSDSAVSQWGSHSRENCSKAKPYH